MGNIKVKYNNCSVLLRIKNEPSISIPNKTFQFSRFLSYYDNKNLKKKSIPIIKKLEES